MKEKKLMKKKKAVGFEVTIQSYEKTLTDNEINEISEKLKTTIDSVCKF